MKLKEIHAQAGSISDYLGYILVLFGWNVVIYGYYHVVPESPGPVLTLVSWGLKLLVGPIVFAIVYGGIYERQMVDEEFQRKNFLSHIKKYVFRFIGANVLSMILLIFVMLVAYFASKGTIQSGESNIFYEVVSAAVSMLMLFWYSALVVEPKMFRSLIHAIKTLLTNPLALAIAILWFVLCFADSASFDINPQQVPLAIDLARSVVFTLLKAIAVVYILAIYKNAWANSIQKMPFADTLAEPPASYPGEGLAKVSLGFAFFSFLPALHLVAMILGVISLKRSQRFILKAAIAVCAGGFFTILYAIWLLGSLAVQVQTVRMPGYAFIAAADAQMQPIVDLLDQEAYQEVQAQLGDSSSTTSSRTWAAETGLALAKYQSDDLNGALKDFYSAKQKNPGRSEFYFYYGLVLLDNKNPDLAKEQFQLALEHEPKLEIAKQYVGLVQNIYEPSAIVSALMYLVILLILFTLHEFGHAFAAWKLGDDTAKDLGRLTLNPFAHLDLFGSILLPAFLLFQHSDFLFGWAKPVPVDTRKFKNPTKDHMLVSFAGPAVNLLVAMVCMIILVSIMYLTRLLWPDTRSLNLTNPYSASAMVGPPFITWILVFIVFLKKLLYTSLILGFFNLLPIPPLDGSWILAGILPEKLRGIFAYIRRFGFMLFILLSLTSVFDYFLSVPIGIAWFGLRWVVSAMGYF